MKNRIRIDLLMVERGLAESRAQAQRLVMAGQVWVDGQRVNKASEAFPTSASIEVERGPRFVSRGGEKLEAALLPFGVIVQGRICADVGASTGGFTDCLLQHGAAKVYAIDVGQGILHWKLRQDPRVIVMEGTNARNVERLPEAITLVTVDVSFISLKVLLPVVAGWFDPNGGEAVALIKPQFEAGRQAVARGQGVIRDSEVHRQVLFEVLEYSQSQGYAPSGLLRSPLQGPKGNIEFLAHLIYPAAGQVKLDGLISTVIPQEDSQ
jgi:23S rRNA (cytidine1920-2'-O)/16S rRNA (cytidine1409-2'-O)-methyltransferase